MKKFLAIFLGILMISLMGISTLAATTTLLPEGETWTSVEVNGENAEILFNEDNTVTVKGSTAAWPCIISNLANPITVAADATITFDFSFTAGTTSIVLFFGEAGAASVTEGEFVVINPGISSELQANSNDILPGDYSGSFVLNSLEALPATIANEDGTYTITGVKVFTVGGAEVIFDKLEIAATAADTSEATSEDTSEATPGTGDTGYLALAILAVVALAGAVVVVKKAR
ncbi:MAG: hypothetical protein A2Y17_10730 [Clostridiales bacterium GWF2_38_85]|nr:MAG: hypothetical protein A2Y17_10730 [Clostridiales bacterium GWF2_38_85]HBL83504.1 hypothetical protein [Clostridiales bacterium]